MTVINRGKYSNQYKLLDKNKILQASVEATNIGLILPLSLLCQRIYEDFYLEGCLLFTTIILLFTIIVLLVDGRRRIPPRIPSPEPTGADKLNTEIARLKETGPEECELAKLLARQAQVNWARRTNVSYNEFPFDQPEYHMNREQMERFARIWSSVPSSSAIGSWYKVENGIVYRTDLDTPTPLIADWWVISVTARYENGNRIVVSPLLQQLHDEEVARNNIYRPRP